MSEDTSDKLSKIKEQIEYYLSDKNLKTDPFFQDKIKQDPDGYIDLYHFQNCNKIINAGWTLSELIEGIKKSSLLELNEDSTRIRRVGNPALPELDVEFLKRKRKKEDTQTDKENCETEGNNEEKDNDKKENKKTDMILKSPITLGNTIYTSIEAISNYLNSLLWSDSDEIKYLTESETKFVKDLSRFHEKKGMAIKVKNCQFIGVGKEGKTNKFIGLDKDKKKKFDFSLSRAVLSIKKKYK